MAKKKTTQAPTPKTNPKFRMSIIAVIILSLLILCGVGFVKFQQHKDGERFASTTTKKSAIVQQLIGHLGNKVQSIQEINKCFNTEQGPWDNGHLWCQSGSLIILNENVNYEILGNEFIRIGSSFGMTYTKDDFFTTYQVMLPEKIECRLAASDSSHNVKGIPASRIFTNGPAPQISLTCADRAKAKHYTYIAN